MRGIGDLPGTNIIVWKRRQGGCDTLKISVRPLDIFQKRRPGFRLTLLDVVQPLPQQRTLRVKQGSEAPRNDSPARVAYI